MVAKAAARLLDRELRHRHRRIVVAGRPSDEAPVAADHRPAVGEFRLERRPRGDLSSHRPPRSSPAEPSAPARPPPRRDEAPEPCRLPAGVICLCWPAARPPQRLKEHHGSPNLARPRPRGAVGRSGAGAGRRSGRRGRKGLPSLRRLPPDRPGRREPRRPDADRGDRPHRRHPRGVQVLEADGGGRRRADWSGTTRRSSPTSRTPRRWSRAPRWPSPA